MMQRSITIITALIVAVSAAIAQAETFSRFAESGLNSWEEIDFEGETRYQVTQEAGQTIVQASSDASASGWVKKQVVDLDKTPILEWRWRLDAGLAELDEQSKQGDDYAARIYVIVKDGWFFWQTRALNYVWSSQQNPPKSWPNAFAPDNATMLPVRTAQDAQGTWFIERRNIQADLKRAFGKKYEEIEAIAFMTDTDNSGGKAKASYGEMRFLESK